MAHMLVPNMRNKCLSSQAAMYLHMIIHFVVVYEAKRTENSREREEKASETEGDEWTRNVYSVWQKYLLTMLLHYLRIVVHYNRHILWKLKLSCPTFLGIHYKLNKTANTVIRKRSRWSLFDVRKNDVQVYSISNQ